MEKLLSIFDPSDKSSGFPFVTRLRSEFWDNIEIISKKLPVKPTPSALFKTDGPKLKVELPLLTLLFAMMVIYALRKLFTI